MIFDSDDLYEGHDRLDLLAQLKEANPAFRMTAFAIPAKCSNDYLDSLPEWIEVVPHGLHHGDPPSDGGECREWSWSKMSALIEAITGPAGHPRWAHGFKAPGWVISTDALEALRDAGWWVADQHYNDHRRPHGLRYHCEGDGDHLHTHVQDVCGNGLSELFPVLLDRVQRAESFELVSEVVKPW